MLHPNSSDIMKNAAMKLAHTEEQILNYGLIQTPSDTIEKQNVIQSDD